MIIMNEEPLQTKEERQDFEMERRTSVSSVSTIETIISEIDDILEIALKRKRQKPPRRNAMVLSGSSASNEYYVLRQSLAVPDNSQFHRRDDINNTSCNCVLSKLSSGLKNVLGLFPHIQKVQEKAPIRLLRSQKENEDEEELKRYTRLMLRTAMLERDLSNIRISVDSNC